MKTGFVAMSNTRRRVILLVLIGMIIFLASLVIHLPAVHAWSLFGNATSTKAYGIRGTAWEGEASTIISGPHRLDSVRWKLQPGSLLSAQLQYEIRANSLDGRVVGMVRTGLGSSLRLENVRFDVDADKLVQRFGNQPLPATIGGRVEGFIERAVIDPDGRLQQIKGLVHWIDGSIRFGESMPLGSYALRLDGRNGQLTGQVQDTDAVLRLEGGLHLNTANGQMTGDVLLQALEGTADILVQGIRFAGIPDPGAENRIDFSGNINNPLGFRGRLR